MKYQLVLQLPAASIKDYDEMIELEEIIMGRIGTLGHVDGHDAGSGEMNIFILTDHPQRVFNQIKQVLGTSDFMPDLKVAFRIIGENEFNILHPEDLDHFAIV